MTGLDFPTPDAENADPESADHAYEAATDYLRNATRDPKQFPLVFEENCNYGFCRNMWGLRQWGLGICIVAVALSALSIFVGATFVEVQAGILVALVIFDLIAAIVWWRWVTPEWVKQPAFAYAERLLEATDTLAQ